MYLKISDVPYSNSFDNMSIGNVRYAYFAIGIVLALTKTKLERRGSLKIVQKIISDNSLSR